MHVVHRHTCEQKAHSHKVNLKEMDKSTAGGTTDVILKARLIEHRGPTDNDLKGRRMSFSKVPVSALVRKQLLSDGGGDNLSNSHGPSGVNC